MVILSSNAISQENIRFIASGRSEAVTNIFFVDVMELALRKSPISHNYQTQRSDDNSITSQERILRLLETNDIDIVWTGTSVAREKRFIPVRIPLFKGLLGYRVFIVHKDNMELFSSLHIEHLKEKIACQGNHWPDSDILEANGFKVFRVGKYDRIFSMMNAKRCDYFPRAIYEVKAEMAMTEKQYPDLRLSTTTLLKYRFPLYFFVNRQNQALADVIESGLDSAIADGSFDALLQRHPTVKDTFPLSQWQTENIVELRNPLLSEETPKDPKYWLELN
jgi:hypothetical protein